MFIVIFIMINYRPKVNNTHFFETSQISLKSNLNFI